MLKLKSLAKLKKEYFDCYIEKLLLCMFNLLILLSTLHALTRALTLILSYIG